MLCPIGKVQQVTRTTAFLSLPVLTLWLPFLLVENQILHIQCFPFSVNLLRLPSLALGDPKFHHHSSP